MEDSAASRGIRGDDLGEEHVVIDDGGTPVEEPQSCQGERARPLGQAGPFRQARIDGHRAGIQQPGAHLNAQAPARLGQ